MLKERVGFSTCISILHWIAAGMQKLAIRTVATTMLPIYAKLSIRSIRLAKFRHHGGLPFVRFAFGFSTPFAFALTPFGLPRGGGRRIRCRLWSFGAKLKKNSKI